MSRTEPLVRLSAPAAVVISRRRHRRFSRHAGTVHHHGEPEVVHRR